MVVSLEGLLSWFALSMANFCTITLCKQPSGTGYEFLDVQVAELDHSPETSFWAKQELERVIAEERQLRCKLWSQGRLHSTTCQLV